MSDKKAKQYSLHSNKQGQVHMLVHRQLCDDREMFGKQLGLGEILSNNLDLAGSDSELDCTGMISQSDNEADSNQTDVWTYNKKLTQRRFYLLPTKILVRIGVPQPL